MKQLTFFFAALMIFSACGDNSAGSAQGSVQPSKELNNFIDSTSYAFGTLYIPQYTPQGINLNSQALADGLGEAINGNAYLDETSFQRVMLAYQTAMAERQGAPFKDDETLPFNVDTLSYALGYGFHKQLESYEMDNLNASTFLQGTLDQVAGATMLDETAAQAQIQKFTLLIQEKQQKKMMEAAGPNIEKGKAFIAEKAKEAGVKGTDSGLHYKVIEAGKGESPAATDRVTVHYTGMLIDGTVFDSSVKRGQPATFGLNQVIPGWTEGVQLMKEGAKYQFYIPYNLAYGEAGSPPNIGPGETLIFDVELISINK